MAKSRIASLQATARKLENLLKKRAEKQKKAAQVKALANKVASLRKRLAK